MTAHHTPPDTEIVALADFDRRSGSPLERLLFNNRLLIVLICGFLSVGLGVSARHVVLNASFESVIPKSHQFIRNYLHYKNQLQGQGNALKIVVSTSGSVLDPDYIETLQHINDRVFLMPGVDRPYMKSLWTPSTRWMAVTEDGFAGGPVMPDRFDGSAQATQVLRNNIERSGEIGQLVAADFRSSILFVPLLDIDTNSNRPLDYGRLSRALEQMRNDFQSPTIRIHIVGFAKVAGDLIGALRQILLFFLVSVAMATSAVFWFTRCIRSTAIVVSCSLVAVVWQVGLLPILGYQLDPYSILVPFLIFAIGMSHGAQKMNGVMMDVGRGMHRLVAARMTFRRLFLAGFTALVCDAVGFAVLLVIDIQAIRSLAIIASVGVGILIFTNLILLPILLSYVGVSATAAQRSLGADAAGGPDGAHPLWSLLDRFTTPRWAAATIAVAILLGAGSWAIGTRLKIGDLDPGAPELRASSRYNQDNAYLTAHYATSTDVLAVLVSTPRGACGDYATLISIDRLEQQLHLLAGVEGTMSGADLARQTVSALNEGNLKWTELVPNQGTLNYVIPVAPRSLFDQDCDLTPIYIYLADHKADTLSRVAGAVQAYARIADTAKVHFLLAAGNAGIQAATNDVVEHASKTMLFYVYGAVILLSLFTFRSWRGVLVAVIPLVLTSIAAQALMVLLGIGVKVATLPVTALGVGIGVDYALYILSVTLAGLRSGQTLSVAYYRALLFTGKVVMLTGVTLAAAVATWAFSPIKFQADMGVLLAFMFLVNMIGALVLLPALACFLLPSSAQSAPPFSIRAVSTRLKEMV